MLKGTLEHKLNGFLKWNPPILVPHPNHTSSAKTRPPTIYDLHLHEDLVLKEIKLLPDLLTDLAGVVDTHIESYKQSIPNPVIGPGFPTYAECRHFSMPDIINESTLVSIYQDTTIEYSTLVASSLLFGRPFSCDDRLLRWTAGSNHSKAIADGFLKIDHNNLKLSELGPASTALPESMKTNIKLLSNWDFEDLMIWEFKSLVAADMEKMQSIGDLVGPFNWIVCGDENRHCAEPKADGSRKSHRNLDGTWVKTGRKTGPDAKSTPWVLPNAASKPKRGKKT